MVPEDELKKDKDNEVLKAIGNVRWPVEGEIKFNNTTMRYRDGMEPSIKGVSFTV